MRSGGIRFIGLAASNLVNTFYAPYYDAPGYIESYPMLSNNTFGTMSKHQEGDLRFVGVNVSWDQRKLYATTNTAGGNAKRLLYCDIAGGGKLVNCNYYENSDMHTGTHFAAIAYNSKYMYVTNNSIRPGSTNPFFTNQPMDKCDLNEKGDIIELRTSAIRWKIL